MPTPKGLIEVVSAVIPDSRGRVLLQRRGPGHEFEGRWETPGGKAFRGEDLRTALRRELEEELRLSDVYVHPRPLLCIAFNPPHVRRAFNITLYSVRLLEGQAPVPMEDATDVGFVDLEDVRFDQCVPSLQMLSTLLRISDPGFLRDFAAAPEDPLATKPDVV